ncbi:MAG: hypothetical protein ABI614_18215 [Planctomycetota bacterium]
MVVGEPEERTFNCGVFMNRCRARSICELSVGLHSMLVCILFIGCIEPPNLESTSANKPQPAKITPLTVEETIGASFLREPSFDVFCRANPEAVSSLRQILTDESQQLYHGNVACMLGYIGNAADALAIEKILESLTGELDGSQKIVVARLFDALALLARRQIPEAELALSKMMNCRYWEDRKLLWHSPLVKPEVPDADVFVRFAILAYAMSERLGLEEKRDFALAQIPTNKRRNLMAIFTGPKHIAGAREDIKRAESFSVSEQSRSWLRNEYKVRFKGATPIEKVTVTRTTSPPVQLSEAPAGDTPTFESEARAEFMAIRQQFLAEHYQDLVGRLLDNGKVLTQDKVTRVAAEYRTDLERTRRHLVQLGEPSLVKESENLDSPDGPESAVLTVLFSVKEGDAVYQEVKPSGSITLGPEGKLLVVMKRIGGKWYWNPFGW